MKCGREQWSEGAAVQDVLDNVEDRLDIKLAAIVIMSCLDLPHHRIVI